MWHAAFLSSWLFPPAWAEVMDKEPSVEYIWLSGLLLGGVFSEIYDSYVGPAIHQEAGNAYILSAYGALGIALMLHVAGLLWRNGLRNSLQRRQPPTDIREEL